MSKSKTIIFRVSEEQLSLIEKAAHHAGKTTNDWCREAALIAAGESGGLSANEKIIFEELAKARYLLGIGFGLLATGELNADSWSYTKRVVDEKGADIAEALLRKRK